MANMRICENCGHFVTVRNCPYCPTKTPEVVIPPMKEGRKEVHKVSKHLSVFTKRYAVSKRKKAVKK